MSALLPLLLLHVLVDDFLKHFFNRSCKQWSNQTPMMYLCISVIIELVFYNYVDMSIVQFIISWINILLHKKPSWARGKTKKTKNDTFLPLYPCTQVSLSGPMTLLLSTTEIKQLEDNKKDTLYLQNYTQNTFLYLSLYNVLIYTRL